MTYQINVLQTEESIGVVKTMKFSISFPCSNIFSHFLKTFLSQKGARGMKILIWSKSFSIILNLLLHVQRNYCAKMRPFGPSFYYYPKSTTAGQNRCLKSITNQTDPIWSKLFRTIKIYFYWSKCTIKKQFQPNWMHLV